MIPSYSDYLQWVSQQNQPVHQPTQPMVAFVANKTAADLFNVNPGQEAVLIDMDMPYVYRKARTSDNKLQPLQWFDLIPHKEPVIKEEVNLDGYVRADELETEYVRRADLNKIISDEVERRMSEVFTKPSRRKSQED